MTNEMPNDPETAKSSSAPKRAAREVESSELLQGQGELLIRHGDELYRLMLTRNGKLILQK